MSQQQLICNAHKNSFFIEGNMNHISIINELCLVYNAIFNLKIKFTESLNNTYSNLIVDNLPYFVYEGYTIKRGFVNSFLQQLVGLDKIEISQEIKKNKMLAIESEIIEAKLLNDLTMSLNLYTYFNYHEKTSYFWKFLKFIYQSFISLKINRSDSKSLLNMNKVTGITSIYEALEYIRNINIKIEEYLIRLGGDKYCTNLANREINAMDLLIYASCKAQIRIIQKSKRNKYNLDYSLYKNLNSLVEEIDQIILNKTQLKNIIKIFPSEELNIPKFTFVNTNYKRYLDIPPDTPEVKKRTLIRKTIISSVFISFLLFLKFYKKS